MAQALNYLRAAGLHRALVLNFGARRFQFRRVVWNYRGKNYADREDAAE